MRGIIGVILILFASMVQSANFQKGLDAFNKSHYKTAYKEWYSLAEQGDDRAQFGLGLMYKNGRGVFQDYEQAVYWYSKAAKQGNADAQLNLGNRYADGQGVLQDYKQAGHWYRKAAKQGYADAQYNLGVRYANGQSVLEEDRQAYMWLHLARYNGRNTRGALSILTPQMTSKSISEAQRMAIVCLESNYENCG